MRLRGYDYTSPGAYFITICVSQRQPLFEQIELRTILESAWKDLPQRFPAVKLDEFVIMPDHVHFILWLDPDSEKRPSIGKIVGGYKSLTAVRWSQYRRMSDGGFWQPGYYEHIIRNEFELEQKREYIRNNPLKAEVKHDEMK